MSTIESPMVRKLWDSIKAIGGRNRRDERFSGSVGDAAHRAEAHTYHISYNDQRKDGGYSMSLWGDIHVPKACRNDAAAIDISSTEHSDLVRVVQRMHHMAVTNPKGLTAMGVREFAGPDDKDGVYAMSERKSGGKSTFVRTYGWNDSHKSHVHISLNRRFTRNARILRIAQFWRGL